jgi:hypothetical protein
MARGNLVDLLNLQHRPPDDETPAARMYIHLPWIGSAAYLHTIFKPAANVEIERASQELLIPVVWQRFLRVQNGAHLYHSLHILGAVDPGRLISRDLRNQVSFGIQKQNNEAKLTANDEWLQIGTYAYSGSAVLMSRIDGKISVTDPPRSRTLARWPEAYDWLTSELTRLSVLFSPEGRLLIDERFTEPGGL